MSNRLGRICPGCKQDLSRSAYYRHQNYPASCPCNQRPSQGEKLPDQEYNSTNNGDEESELSSAPDVSAADSVGESCSDCSDNELEVDEVEVATNVQEQTRNDNVHINSILKAVSFIHIF